MLQYYNLMGQPFYMRSVIDQNVVMRRVPVNSLTHDSSTPTGSLWLLPMPNPNFP